MRLKILSRQAVITKCITLAFFLLVALVGRSQSALEIKYNRTILNFPEINTAYIHRYSVSIEIRLLVNDSFGFVFCKDIPASLKRKKKQVGEKLIRYASFYDFTTDEKFAEINFPRNHERLVFDSSQLFDRPNHYAKKRYKYLVSAAAFNPDWQFINVQKIILDKVCYQALSIDKNNDSILVWYTMELPFKKGPLWYDNLPGIILELFDQKRNAHMIATKIDIREIELVPPKDGPRISHAEWMEIYKTIPPMNSSSTITFSTSRY